MTRCPKCKAELLWFKEGSICSDAACNFSEDPPPTVESTSAALRRVEQERDDHYDHLLAMEGQRNEARRERDLARAELVSARAGGVLDSWVRYLCETCSARYSINFPDHEHGPLTPVLVTLTRRTEEHETA